LLQIEERRREVHKMNLRGKLKERDLGVCGRIIIRRFFISEIGSMEWIDLAQDKERWLGVVKASINPEAP
jgi:hypothetical protein